MNKTTIAILLFCISAVLISGCAGTPAGSDPWPTAPDDIPAQPESLEPPIIVQNPESNVVDANNAFAFDLYSRYKTSEGNMFFSPYSISSALTMAYEGAGGRTADEMRAVLHLPDDKQKIRNDYLAIIDELNKADNKYQLSVANALWAQMDFPFRPDYLNVIDQYYGGKTTNLDFRTQTEKSRVAINYWVEEKTNDRIKDIIPKGALASNTRLVLTNAIYFKANWSSQFKTYMTHDDKFKLESGDEVNAKFMTQTGVYNYGETEDLQILEMDYRGDDLSMLIILPKEDTLSGIEGIISPERLEEWKSVMTRENVLVSIPKFNFEKKYFMKDDLKSMGMPTAFSMDNADFTGMYDRNTAGENLYISDVIHQTFIEVAENGTEAAAATAVMMAGGTASPGQPKLFTADHPFIFIIQYKDTGNILFMGRLDDPTKEN